ncbi:MAG: discoidin domain-containing protein [Candidatus Binatia bacterium]
MRSATTGAWLVALLLIGMIAGRPATVVASVLLDDFESLDGWTTTASEGARVWILPEAGRTGSAMRVGFDFDTGGGYVIVRKAFSVALPENFAFTFQLRGEGRRNNLEFKLVDPSGKNVWWRNLRDFVLPVDWQRMTIRKSRLDFAWGPAGGGTPTKVGTIEIAISAGEGGGGWFVLDDLAFEERDRATRDGVTPDVRASSFTPGHEPLRMMDDDPTTSWQSEPGADEQWVIVDLVRNWEYGGLVIDWDPVDYATAYEVQVSNDRVQWTTVYATASGKGGRDYVYMPDAESRFIRLRMPQSSRGRGVAILDLAIQPVDFSASPNHFFQAVARDAPIGMYPKYLYGRQTYWTVVGVDGDGKEALLNEEGMLEVDKGSFSIEPFLYVDDTLVTWSAVEPAQELEDGYLPIPTVTWRAGDLVLRVSPFAGGRAGASMLYARYRLENRGDRAVPVRLFLAVRPFQVNPPWQSLTMNGGTTTIQELRFDGRVVTVNREKMVVALTPPDRFGAVSFQEGAITEFLAAGNVPGQTHVYDPFGFASGALQYSFHLEPHGQKEVDLAIPFREASVAPVQGLGADDARALVAAEHELARRLWQKALGRVEIDLPPEAEPLAHIVKTTLAYILINRDGPALRPGSRNYQRSWIRDGAITSSALLEMGFTDEVRDFLRWYARYQGADGKVPCCVDRRGADPVSENDSAGQFVYAIMEYYRHTHDAGFLADMWPNVTRAVEYMTALRAKRMTDEYRTPEKEAFFGLLPESISHEGYSAHPVHSYWDDFFALRGFKDAADMALVVGDEARAVRFAALRDQFGETLFASIARTLAKHAIDYIPGSVELGDFDPTSTSIAVAPAGEHERLPAAALARTFDRYWQEFAGRRSGGVAWDAYSPYEIRNAEALLRLGQKERALTVLDDIVADRRPLGWNEWAEISWRDARAPRFIGDMPHTWVGAGFIRTVRALFAYERESDHALVVGAGVRAAWVTGEHGVTVRRLPTHYGVLHLSVRAEGSDAVRVRLSGDIVVPPGGIVVESPLADRVTAATVNGRRVEELGPDHATIREFPADVLLRHEGAGLDAVGRPKSNRPG